MPSFPNSGGANTPWKNINEMYVDPSGNDGNNGKGWNSPFKTIYAALLSLIQSGGGTLYVADGCTVGGPVTGQGIWLRGDGFSVPGFLPVVPLRIVGAGDKSGGHYMPDNVADFVGGGERGAFPIWICRTDTSSVTFENLRTVRNKTGPCAGVDFDRLPSGARNDLTVTNGTRTGTNLVLTVTPPAPLDVVSASRTSNVTSIVVTNPGIPWPNMRQGSTFAFVCDDVDFPDGTYTVISILGSRGGLTQPTWTISYTDAGTDQASTPVDATVQSHGCITGDWIELFSNDSVKFANTMYPVTAQTLTTITVTDKRGNGNQNVNNIGTLCRYEFRHAGTSSIFFKKVGTSLFQANKAGGPGWLIGHNNAIPPTLINCYGEGLMGPAADVSSATRDERRQALLYAWGGVPDDSTDINAVGVRIDQQTGIDGSIYIQSDNSIGEVFVSNSTLEWELDAEIQALKLPAVRVVGGPNTKVYIADLQNADAVQNDHPPVILSSCIASACTVVRTGPNVIQGGCIGGDTFWVPSQWGPGANTPPPWARDQVTCWADGRITGKHPGSPRALGVVQSRIKNIMTAPSGWTLRGATRTLNDAAMPAPDGTITATKIVSAGDYVSLFPQATTGDTWAVGGHFVVCGWVNAGTNLGLGSDEFLYVNTSGVTFSDSYGGVAGRMGPSGYCGTGWQFVQKFLTVGTVSDSTPDIELESLIANGLSVWFWGMTCFYVPHTIDINDVSEYIGTIRHQPRYLVAGMSGTMEGQKLVAHGGMGTAARYVVGVGSGQITVGAATGAAVELFDESGNSLGVVAPLSFTVNP